MVGFKDHLYGNVDFSNVENFVKPSGEMILLNQFVWYFNYWVSDKKKITVSQHKSHKNLDIHYSPLNNVSLWTKPVT